MPGEEFTTVAVKMLKDDATDDMQSDFEREALILSEFDHPNIVKLHDVYEDEKYFFLIMELMTGGELFDQILTKEKFTE